MNRLLIAGIALAASGLAAAQTFPFELEADRKPKLQTGGNVLIKGARVLTATRGTLENTDILVQNGKIAKLGRNLTAPDGTLSIDARGKVVMPGIIDGHSHRASDGTNEGADSITGEVRIGDVLNATSLNLWTALASGHTAAVILHGSANAVGGQSIVIKYKYGKSPADLPVPDAPRQIKFALGENVTRKGDTGTTPRFPRSRMGVEAVYRRGFQAAREYRQAWKDFESGASKVRPRRDLRLETLADILDRKIWVQCHSYRSDEMLMLVRLSQEFGFKIGAMQHALEAYKIAPELAKAGVGVSIFVDNWSFKLEGYDAIPWNAAICTNAGVNVSINTDGLAGTSALNIDAAKVMRFGGLSEQQAIQMLTINPARQLGIDGRTGSIEVGKDADLAIWDGHPLSVYSKCALTMVEGEVFFQRRDAFGIDAVSTVKPKLDPMRNRTENLRTLPPGGSYAIVGATVYPVSSAPIANGTVVIRDGKIVAVGRDIAVPAGARVVDGRGLRVYPGFIDALTTLGLAEIGPIPVSLDTSEVGGAQPDLDALTALWVESAHFGPARFNGVLNAFIAPSFGPIAGQGAVIHTDGRTVEEFGLARRQALIANFSGATRRPELDLCEVQDASVLLGLGGATPEAHGHSHEPGGDEHLTLSQLEAYYDLLGGKPQETPAPSGTSPMPGDAEVIRFFDRAIEYAKQRAANPALPIDLEMEAMQPYVRGEKLVILNVRTAAQIRQAVAFAQKYKLKVALAGASEAWKETTLLRRSGIPVILTPAGRSTLGANTVDNPWDPYDTPYVTPGLLEKAGVKFAFRSGSGSESMNLPVRVGQHCAYGLTPDGALRSLTLNAAQILGVADRLGSLEPGKLANLFVTDGDPFEMTSTMRYVFINGHPVPLTSKHTMLRDKYASRR